MCLSEGNDILAPLVYMLKLKRIKVLLTPCPHVHDTRQSLIRSELPGNLRAGCLTLCRNADRLPISHKHRGGLDPVPDRLLLSNSLILRGDMNAASKLSFCVS